jgi:tetratricopeptide (TPR) repeat protein
LTSQINKLGGAHVALGLLQTREKQLREGSESDDFSHGIALYELADQYLVCLEVERGLEAVRDALPILEKHLGERHPRVALAVATIVAALTRLTDHENAEGWAARLEDLLEHSDPRMSGATAVNCAMAIAGRHMAMGHWDKAADALERGMRLSEDGPSEVTKLVEILMAVGEVLQTDTADERWVGFAQYALSTFGPRNEVTAVAHQFLCMYLERQEQPRRLAEAKTVQASVLHAIQGSDNQRTRAVFVQLAEAWRDANDYEEAQKWFAKALRGFTVTKDTMTWWAQALTSAGSVKLRCGRLAEVDAEAASVLAAALAPLPDDVDPRLEALNLRARVAIWNADGDAARAFVRELERRSALLGADDGDRANGLRNVARLHCFLGDAGSVSRVATEAREASRRIWPKAQWAQDELHLLEILATHNQSGRVPRGVTIDIINERLASIRSEFAPGSPVLGEQLIRCAGPVSSLGDAERAISMLREGIEIVRKTCGPFHPELAQAEASLGKLTAPAA